MAEGADITGRGRRVARWLPAGACVAAAAMLGAWSVLGARPGTRTWDVGPGPAVRLSVGGYGARTFLDVVVRDPAHVGPSENVESAGLGLFFHLGPTNLIDAHEDGMTLLPAVGLQLQAPTRGLGIAASAALIVALLLAGHARRPQRDPHRCPGCGGDPRLRPGYCPECAMPRDDLLGSTVAHG